MQRLHVIDIVPFAQHGGGKPDFGRALACAARYGFGSPCDVREQVAMRLLEADEVVASVACRPKHHAVAGFTQRCNGLCEQTGWQRWAVAIDEQNTVMSRIQ